jgi:hypothetical protein
MVELFKRKVRSLGLLFLILSFEIIFANAVQLKLYYSNIPNWNKSIFCGLS